MSIDLKILEDIFENVTDKENLSLKAIKQAYATEIGHELSVDEAQQIKEEALKMYAKFQELASKKRKRSTSSASSDDDVPLKTIQKDRKRSSKQQKLNQTQSDSCEDTTKCASESYSADSENCAENKSVDEQSNASGSESEKTEPVEEKTLPKKPLTKQARKKVVGQSAITSEKSNKKTLKNRKSEKSTDESDAKSNDTTENDLSDNDANRSVEKVSEKIETSQLNKTDETSGHDEDSDGIERKETSKKKSADLDISVEKKKKAVNDKEPKKNKKSHDKPSRKKKEKDGLERKESDTENDELLLNNESESDHDDVDAKSEKENKQIKNPKAVKLIDKNGIEIDPKIKRLRGLMVRAGLRIVKNVELDHLKSKKARYDYILNIFKEAGFEGLPSKKTCAEFKEKKDREKELAELSRNTIISSSGSKRVTRGTCIKVQSPVVTKSPQTSGFSRIKGLYEDSDNTSDDDDSSAQTVLKDIDVERLNRKSNKIISDQEND